MSDKLIKSYTTTTEYIEVDKKPEVVSVTYKVIIGGKEVELKTYEWFEELQYCGECPVTIDGVTYVAIGTEIYEFLYPSYKDKNTLELLGLWDDYLKETE